MKPGKSIGSRDQPGLALAVVGSNVTAIGAELISVSEGYDKVMAIIRRNTHTTLPVAMDGDEWAVKLRKLGLFEANREVDRFLEMITGIVGGKAYDCYLHHSNDPFSQLLVVHPLCRKFFYMEEGITSHIGGKFSRPKKRPVKRWVWKWKSALFYKNRVRVYGPHFDLESPKYGGVHAFSKGAFKDFPMRRQLPLERVEMTSPVSADVAIFLDSQYFLGRCTVEEYAKALTDCLRAIVTKPSSVAIKFHPAEKNGDRRNYILGAIKALPDTSELTELPPEFIGERMNFDPGIKVVVGTTALGLYLGERGFETYTFAPRLAAVSTKFAEMLELLPADFQKVCKSA